jgi:hypothetical protein
LHLVFAAGQVVQMREVHNGELWAQRPMRVVKDDETGVHLWLPVGTRWRKPVTLDGSPWRFPVPPWKIVDDVWKRIDILHVIEIHNGQYRPYAIWHIWNRNYFVGWYINMQSPLQRVADGFEYLDHALDLVIKPDLSYRWKDEDELEAYVERGVLSRAEAAEVRANAELVLERAMRRNPPFDGSLRRFRSDPSWPLPELS